MSAAVRLATDLRYDQSKSNPCVVDRSLWRVNFCCNPDSPIGAVNRVGVKEVCQHGRLRSLASRGSKCYVLCLSERDPVLLERHAENQRIRVLCALQMQIATDEIFYDRPVTPSATPHEQPVEI